MDRRLWKWLGILAFGLLAAAPIRAAEPDPQIVSVLQHWETTSQTRTREGLCVRTLQPFLGPVREDCLLQRFTWSILSDSELEAVPIDPAERQFSPGVRISIDSDGLPQSVVIGQLQKSVRDLARAEIAQVASRESLSTESSIVRVSFDPDAEVGLANPVSPRIREVISRWVTASKSANALRTSFQRIDYDSVIEVETHATGEFVFCAPFLGLYKSVASPIEGAAAGTRIGLQGQSYVRLPGADLLLVWNGRELTQVNLTARRYEVHAHPGTPREVLGAGSFDATWQTLIAPQSALPMVVGLVEKELLSNYEWELVADHQTAIVLRGTPIDGPDAGLYTSAQVVIDPVSYRTQATRMIDIAGSKETFHQFQDHVVSVDPKSLGEWQPDLTRFERVGEVPGVEAAAPRLDDDQPPAPPTSDE